MLFFFARVVKVFCQSCIVVKVLSLVSALHIQSLDLFLTLIEYGAMLSYNCITVHSTTESVLSSKRAFMQPLISCHFSSPTQTSSRMCGYEEYEIHQK